MAEFYTSALNGNETKSQELRNLLYSALGSTLIYLKEENFERWINKREISDRLKKLILKEFTEEDIKEHSDATGFYVRGKNLIKLLNKDKKTITHELFHFLTDNRMHFSIFIDEGITEYLTMLANNNSTRSYAANVDFVEFVHKAMGDSFIKAYLKGVDNELYNEFGKYFDGIIGLRESANLTRFNAYSTKMHEFLYGTDEEKKENLNPKELREKLSGYYQIIAENAIDKRARELKYYRYGKLDINEAIKDIAELSNSYNSAIRMLYYQMDEIPLADEDFYKKCLEKVIINSHLLVDYDNDKERLDKLVNSVLNEMRDDDGKVRKLKKSFDFDVITKSDDRDMPYKLADTLIMKRDDIYSFGELDITKCLMMIALIKDKTRATDFQMETIVKAGLSTIVDKSVNMEYLTDTVKQLSKLYSSLECKRQEDIRDTVDTKIMQISEGLYIEKRDSELYLMEIDKETGEISKKHFFEAAVTAKLSEFPGKDIKNFKEDTRLFKIKYGMNELRLAVDENFENFFAYDNNKKIENVRVFNSTRDLAENYLIEELIFRALGNDKRRYINILDDAENPYMVKGMMWTADVDTRSRKINFEEYFENLSSVISLFDDEKREQIIEEKVSEILTSVYGKIDDKCKEKVIDLSKKYVISGNGLKEKVDILEELDSMTGELNEVRKLQAEENKKTASYFFRNHNDRMRYESVKQVRKIEKEKEVATNFFMDSIDECVEEKVEYPTMNFPGVMIVGAYRTRKANTINFEKYIDIFNQALENIAEERREDFVEDITKKSLEILLGESKRKKGYGIIYHNGEENEDYKNEQIEKAEREERREEIYREMTSLIYYAIFNDGENIDDKREAFEALQEEIKMQNEELDKEAQNTSVLLIPNDQIKDLYKRAKEIEKSSDIPEEAKKMVLDSLRTAANALNMADLAKSALQGPNLATSASVSACDKNMSTDKKVGVDIND